MVKACAADLTEETLRLAFVDKACVLFFSRSSSEDREAFLQALNRVRSPRAAEGRPWGGRKDDRKRGHGCVQRRYAGGRY